MQKSLLSILHLFESHDGDEAKEVKEETPDGLWVLCPGSVLRKEIMCKILNVPCIYFYVIHCIISYKCEFARILDKMVEEIN